MLITIVFLTLPSCKERSEGGDKSDFWLKLSLCAILILVLLHLKYWARLQMKDLTKARIKSNHHGLCKPGYSCATLEMSKRGENLSSKS